MKWFWKRYMKVPEEGTIVTVCKLDGIIYKLGYRFYGDGNRIEQGIMAVAKYMVSTLAQNSDILDDCDWIMQRKYPDKYFTMMEERARGFNL